LLLLLVAILIFSVCFVICESDISEDSESDMDSLPTETELNDAYYMPTQYERLHQTEESQLRFLQAAVDEHNNRLNTNLYYKPPITGNYHGIGYGTELDEAASGDDNHILTDTENNSEFDVDNGASLIQPEGVEDKDGFAPELPEDSSASTYNNQQQSTDPIIDFDPITPTEPINSEKPEEAEIDSAFIADPPLIFKPLSSTTLSASTPRFFELEEVPTHHVHHNTNNNNNNIKSRNELMFGIIAGVGTVLFIAIPIYLYIRHRENRHAASKFLSTTREATPGSLPLPFQVEGLPHNQAYIVNPNTTQPHYIIVN